MNYSIKDLAEYITVFFKIPSNKLVDNQIYTTAKLIIENELTNYYIEYLNNNSYKDKYTYLNPLIKFTKITSDFLKEFRRINSEDRYRANVYADKLKIKLFRYLEEVEYILSTTSNHIKNLKLSSSFNLKEMKVLNLIGTNIDIYNLYKFSKLRLEEKIIEVVENLVEEQKSITIQLNKNDEISNSVLTLICQKRGA